MLENGVQLKKKILPGIDWLTRQQKLSMLSVTTLIMLPWCQQNAFSKTRNQLYENADTDFPFLCSSNFHKSVSWFSYSDYNKYLIINHCKPDFQCNTMYLVMSFSHYYIDQALSALNQVVDFTSLNGPRRKLCY